MAPTTHEILCSALDSLHIRVFALETRPGDEHAQETRRSDESAPERTKRIRVPPKIYGISDTHAAASDAERRRAKATFKASLVAGPSAYIPSSDEEEEEEGAGASIPTTDGKIDHRVPEGFNFQDASQLTAYDVQVTGQSDLPVFTTIPMVQRKLNEIFTGETSKLMTDFMDYVKSNASSLLKPDGEYPNRRVLAKNRSFWEAFKKSDDAFKQFDKDNTKLYLAMYVGKIVPIPKSDHNFYANDMSLDGTASYLQQRSGKMVPNHNGYLLDSASIADPDTPDSQMKTLAAQLGWAHLFQHRCIDYNCQLDTVSFKKTKLPVICWKNNSKTPKENEELTIHYSDNYVKPLQDWIDTGYGEEQLKPCEWEDCQTGRCKNYIPDEKFEL